MKTIQHSTRWLGLVLAGSIISLAASAQAGKPVKPPPEPPPESLYNLILLNGSPSSELNEAGMVRGGMNLLVPQSENGSTVWFKDDDSDGLNDLVVNLGRPGWGAMGMSAHSYDMNDDGVIVGRGNRELIPDSGYYTTFAWFLAPQMINGRLTWAELDAVEINPLIMPLNETTDTRWDAQPMCINNHGEVALVIEESWNLVNPIGQKGYLLLPNAYEVSPEGAVTVDYPAEDLDGDTLNDALISLGTGIRLKDGTVRPLLPQVINDRGDVAGVVWAGNAGSVGSSSPFVLRPRVDQNLGLVWNDDQNSAGTNSLALPLPLPTDVTPASISDMNETGTLVGYVYYGYTKGTRAAIWQVDWESETATYTEVGAKGNKSSCAYAVNAAGQVVGVTAGQAWLWDQGNVVPLSDLVPEFAGHAVVPTGINDRGMIVGLCDGVPFIAVPVEQP